MWIPWLLNILPFITGLPIEGPRGNRLCLLGRDSETNRAPGLLPLRLQLRPFQRESDPVGACLDGANRSIQFCRDHFGAGVRFRHSSKEVILLWRPPVAAEFNHVTTIFPSPSARARPVEPHRSTADPAFREAGRRSFFPDPEG